MRLKFHHCPPQKKHPQEPPCLAVNTSWRNYEASPWQPWMKTTAKSTLGVEPKCISTGQTQKYHWFRHTTCTRFQHVQPCSTYKFNICCEFWHKKNNPSHPTLMLAVAIAISIGFRSLYGDLDLARATPFTSGTRKPLPKNTSIWTVLSWRKIEPVYPGKGSVIRLGSQANSLPDRLRSTTIHLDCSLQQNDKTEEFCRLSCFFSSKKQGGL